MRSMGEIENLPFDTNQTGNLAVAHRLLDVPGRKRELECLHMTYIRDPFSTKR